MLEENIDIAPLLVKYLDNMLSADEHEQLMRWVRTSDKHRKLFQDLQEPEKMKEYLDQYSSIDSRAAYSNWKSDQADSHQNARENPVFVPSIRHVHFLRTVWFRCAAVILLLGTGVYYWFHQDRQPSAISDSKHIPVDILPGKEGAILTLADGSQVVLDSVGNGVIALQNGYRIVMKNGQLAYDQARTAAGKMMYNSITTPKGRQFSVVLQDGTKVWLNAVSSLRYPTVFSGKNRVVEVTGEAYFEVAKDKAKPFLVRINDAATVEVLGTSFNVNAYKNEANIHTTLLDGSVRVTVTSAADGQTSAGQPSVILKPGQQAAIGPVESRSGGNGTIAKAGIRLIENADIDKATAWKNGVFNFDGASLADVMRQLERWYDIEVVYEKNIPNIHFVGKMSRDVNLAELIKGLEGLEVHLRIEKGRRLIVMP